MAIQQNTTATRIKFTVKSTAIDSRPNNLLSLRYSAMVQTIELKRLTELETMMRKNKYLYGWKFLVNYGQGWEYECFELTREAMKIQRIAYRQNCPFPFKIVLGRELNT